MKKQLLCAILACAGVAALAQPTLTQSQMLPFGTTMVFKTAQNELPIDTTIKGANVTWDCSALEPDLLADDLNMEVMSPANTPFGSSFPNANYAYRETPDLAYRYFNLASNKFERVGSYSSGANIYNDPQIEMTFPLTMGTHNLDGWDNTQSSSGGTYEFECIGYGKLKLPNATYNNALMLRVHMIEDPFIDMFAYFWYNADNGAMLLEYVVGDGFFVGTFVQYLSSITTPQTAVTETSPVNNLSYTNPVKDQFRLSFTTAETTLEYTLTDQLGRVIAKDTHKAAGNTMQNLSIDMQQLQQGLYFLNIQSPRSNQAQSLKLLKQ